jgi:acyl-CoA thioester hydrolase
VDYDDPIFVHTRFRDLHGVRIDFDYLITHGDTGRVLCKGFTRHCAVNRKGVPVAVDAVTVGIYRGFPT